MDLTRHLRTAISGREALLAAVVLVLLLFLFPRLAGLGSVLSVDEPLWRARAHQFYTGLSSGRLGLTFQSGQPGVTTMWLVGLATPLRTLAASQASVAVGTTVLFLLALLLLARLTGPSLPLAGGVFLALDPFLITHSRTVHTDALLAAFLFLGLVLLALFWQTGKLRYLAYGGIVASLSALTKFFGLFLLLPAAVVLFAAPARALEASIPPRRRFGQRARRFLLPALLTVIIAWPAVYTAPGRAFGIIQERLILHATSAAVGSGGGDTWYYPRQFVRRLTPWQSVLLPVALLGIAGVARRRAPFPARGFTSFLLATALAYTLSLSIAEQKADRYILILHVAAALAASGAILWLVSLIWTTARARTVAAVSLLALVTVLQTRELATVHPDYHAYWNRLLPIPADAKYGWGEGLELAAGYIAAQDIPRQDLRIASYYPGVLAHFLPGALVDRVQHYENPEFQFVVLYRSMYGREKESAETAILRSFLGKPLREGETVTAGESSFRLERVFTLGRLPYVWVFRRLPSPQPGEFARRTPK